MRLRTGENDRDASRLLIVVRPKPGVPLVARLSGSVSGRDTTGFGVNTRECQYRKYRKTYSDPAPAFLTIVRSALVGRDISSLG